MMAVSSASGAGGGTVSKAQKGTGLFGSVEHKSRRLEEFTKWQMVVAHHVQDLAGEHYAEPQLKYGSKLARSGLFKPICKKGSRFQCPKDQWADLTLNLADEKPLKQLEKINKFFNGSPYITDINNWGLNDYWATMRQFFSKDGDCEDYAIAKYFTLKKLGFNQENMRIAIVQDLNLGVAHAILIVYLNGKALVLDNQIPYVVSEKTILHYKPLYSINESAWWLHE